MQRITNVFSPEFGQFEAQTHNEGHTHTNRDALFFFASFLGIIEVRRDMCYVMT